MKHYADRDILAQGDYYARHVMALTAESLHDKSDIAAELAHRDQEINRLRAELDALRQFAREMMDAWPDGGIEGDELQESAVRCGLLTETQRSEWCGDNCACGEFHDFNDDRLPVTCLRKAAWLVKDAP